jgi:hypothetical protein
MDGTPGTASASKTTSEHTVDIREEAAADARAVADTAKDQTRSAMSGMKQEFRRQMSEQKSHLVGTLREFGDELDKASSNSSGTVADVASEAANKARRVSGWVDSHEPADAVRSVEDFARRRPMLFLVGAAAAGAVIGRITRNAMAARRTPSTGTGMDRGYYAGGPRTDPEYLGTEQQLVTGEVPPIGGPSGQAMQPHMTGEPVDEARLSNESGPLSQRAYDATSEYPSNDQPVVEVGEELPAPGTRIGQGPRPEGGRR